MGVPPIRAEIAFSTAPDDPNPAYVDVTQWLDLTSGLTIARGRPDEFATVQPGTCSFVLDNTDGRFTAGLASSPYYPNVKLRRKVRFSARVPGATGNGFIDPTFESGFTDWIATGNPAPSPSWSTVQAHSASHSMLITWAAGNVFFPAMSATLQTVIGRQYTVATYAFVPAANPAVQLLVTAPFVSGAASSVTGSWQRISVTFTATTQTSTVSVLPVGTPTAGQLCYVDDAMWDEGTLATFTTTPLTQSATNLAGPISYRFTGYMDEWPVEWPGGSVYAEARVTAIDRFKRMGALDPFRSIVEQEILSDSPYAYYTLGETAGATQVGDTSKNGRAIGTIKQLGAGGTLTLGAGTGPSTDGLTAAVFTRASQANGKFLNVKFGVASNSLSGGQSVECFFNTNTAGVQSVVDVQDSAGNEALALSVDATGHLVGVALFDSVGITSAIVVSDGATHHAALAQSIVGTTVTLTLYLDGVSVGSNTWTSAYGALLPWVSMNVGGNSVAVFNGTISHAVCFDGPVTAARIADHAASGRTGFSGESSNARIARLARYVGIPTAEQNLETGLSTSIAFVDITDAAPLQAMQDVTTTENGVLQIDGQGRLAFQARGHRYNTSSALTLAGVIDPSAKFVVNDQLLKNDVTGSRAGGITFRAVNAQSKTDYGPARDTLALLTTSDNEVVDAANWRANQNAQPAPRLPTMSVDILANTSLQAGVLALDVSSRVTASLLPTSAPAASVDLFIEGWTETINANQWLFTYNTSPATASSVWQIGSATYGQLDVSTRLAY